MNTDDIETNITISGDVTALNKNETFYIPTSDLTVNSSDLTVNSSDLISYNGYGSIDSFNDDMYVSLGRDWDTKNIDEKLNTLFENKMLFTEDEVAAIKLKLLGL